MIHQQGIPPPESEVLSLAPGTEAQISLSEGEVGLKHKRLLLCNKRIVLTVTQNTRFGLLKIQDTSANVISNFSG